MSAVNYCVSAIYIPTRLKQPEEIVKGDPAKPSSCIMEIPATKNISVNIAWRSQMPALVSAQQRCIVRPSHRICIFCPSHLPPLANLYVNSLFPKQCNIHIYPSGVEAQQSPVNGLCPHMGSSHVNHSKLVPSTCKQT